MFTRQNYIEVARIIGRIQDPKDRDRIRMGFVRMFSRDNVRFNAGLFAVAVADAARAEAANDGAPW